MTAAMQYDDSLSDIKKGYLTYEYRPLRKSLENLGWRTPQTYCRSFDSEGDFPAVYLFLLVGPIEFLMARPAYVGMSTHLSQRWSGHEVLRELENTQFWVQRWFLRTPKSELRMAEKKLIHKFDPPWNVVGRRRGMDAL